MDRSRQSLCATTTNNNQATTPTCNPTTMSTNKLWIGLSIWISDRWFRMHYMCVYSTSYFTYDSTNNNQATTPPVTPPQCQQINCGFHCPYGFQRNNFGCYVCVCIPPPILPTIAKPTTKAPTPGGPVCGDLICNRFCPYGFYVDARGCPLCQCIPAPGSAQTTKAATTTKTTTDELNQRTTKSNQTETPKLTGVTVVTKTRNNPTAYLPYIVGGVAIMGVVLLVILALNCRQSKKQKGPAPPPPDYPTIEKSRYRQHDREPGYAHTITDTQKRKKKKQKQKNSYVQNEPTPPTISQKVSHQSFSNIHSLDRSIKGETHSPHSQSLSRPLPNGSLRPYSKQNMSQSRLSLDRGFAGGRLTPNSQILSQSMPRQSRFVPIDQMYANTLNRSVASDPNTFGTTKSSRSGAYQQRGTVSYQNTPRSHHRANRPQTSRQSSRQSHHSSMVSMSSTPPTPSSVEIPMESDPHDGFTTPNHYQNSPHPSHRSMYANLPAQGTLDRVHVDLSAADIIRDDHTYMDPMEINSLNRQKIPQEVPSTTISSLPRSHDRRRKKGVGRGPRLHINKKMSASTSSINSLGSHFGDNKLEMTTPL
ncbi:uncharacterized protein [Amphiura filiformis]|uniref:uncharacterized protein n=1 Tax=Amphiura filiformis TaxID=82378 RepID=UPI003B216EA9